MIHQLSVALEQNRNQNKCLVVAVTGSIACGKSAVSRMLEQLGAVLIDFDRIAREVVTPESQGFEQIVSHFGPGVVQPDGILDRKALSDIVFADTRKHRQLERITHPLIFDAFVKKLKALASDHPNAVIQVAVPLLIELNMQHMFDRVIVVYLPHDIQLKRLAARDDIPEEAAAAIINYQLSPDEKRQFADYVIDNSRDRNDTQQQVNLVWKHLQYLQKQRHQTVKR